MSRHWMPVSLLAAACTPATDGQPDSGRIHVPASTFVMGTVPGRVERLKSDYGVGWPGVFENELPAHEVSLGGFRIDAFEVTNAEFAAFVRDVPAWQKGALADAAHNGDYLADWEGDRYPAGRGRHPVAYVTWGAAQSYCRWRGGRLPTEAEWEFVAQGGESREFPWGAAMPDPELANYGASGVGGTVAVGTYPPNDLGVYDLAGNVWEFLLDEWMPEYPGSPQRDPVAGGAVEDESIEEVGGRRAVRGGSYDGAVVNLRTRWRDSHVVTNATAFVGFRCAYPGSD